LQKQREVPVQIVIRKRRRHGEAHGGAWKVAFADFMTGMFALFLVLWLVNQSSDVKSSIAGYFQDPLGRADEYGSSILPGEGTQSASPRILKQTDVLNLRRAMLEQAAADIKERLEETPDLSSVQNNIEISITEDGLRIELIEDSTGVFFETGRPAPSARGREMLALLGSELGDLDFPVRIEGHTDAVPYRDSTSYGNWELSADRANTARRILVQSGLRASQLASVSGLADREPRVQSNPFDASNRRITITMLLRASGGRANAEADRGAPAPGREGS
jgi:chemotaxis protein MotB